MKAKSNSGDGNKQPADVSKRNFKALAWIAGAAVLFSLWIFSLIPLALGAYVLLLRLLKDRHAIQKQTVLALYWLGLGPISTLRLLEYKPYSSVFDPIFGLFLFVTIIVPFLFSARLALNQFASQRFGQGLISVLIVLVPFYWWRTIGRHLLETLNLYMM